jgi:HD superfamily phosphohydrolase
MEIRDPIHGPIEVTPAEKRVIDHPLVQRLRRIRQLGFSESTFPGATHTRFLHSLGTMHLAGLAFDAIAPDLSPFPADVLGRARAALRLAALLHDIGHPPLSHTGEALLPLRRDLHVSADGALDAPAAHEEMTRALLLGSDLAGTLSEAFASLALRPEDVAMVLGGPGDDPFVADGVTLLPLLRQLIAGELDVDRMDYLLRDSYFTGVTYGRFEKDWLLSHVGAHRVGDGMFLALDSAAIFAFEDFLLSRYHMFLMVYAHHKTLAYHRMLEHFLEGPGRDLRLPADPVAFCDCDDEWLLARMRAANDPWSRRILAREPLQLAVEGWDDDATSLADIRDEIRDALPTSCDWVDSGVDFSHYFSGGRPANANEAPLLVRIGRPGSRRSVLPVEQYSDLYARQARRKRVMRLYCEAADVDAAAVVVSRALDWRDGRTDFRDTGVDD